MMHSFCLQGDRSSEAKSDMKICTNVFILTFEISSGNPAGPSGKGKSSPFLVGELSNITIDQKLRLNPLEL